MPNEDNFFSDYGTFSHELLEKWAKGELPDIALASEYEAGYDNAVIHAAPPFPKGMPQKYYDAGLQYFENFDGFGDDYEILTVEKKFELDIEGYHFVGIADLVLRDKKTQEIIVIDHKSKSMNAMKKELNVYRKQLYTYAAFVKQEFGVYPSLLRFNMFKEGVFIDEPFDEAEFHRTMDWIVETIETILFESEWKISTSSYFCRFICGVLDSCPAKNAILYPPK